uniref:Hyaluronidase n=1 Tax=Heliothis virescens TaxID=7102 RepID=A0A2A4JXM0_HELVI
MRTLLFIFLAGCAVRCDDSNYYVVQMPDNDVLPTKEFKVYWNVPTKQCKSKRIYFEDLYQKYGIIQNTGDTFRGDKISILYDPGDFPALLRNSTSGELKYRNGGVPQEGDLIKHLDTFQKVLEQSVPDKNFSGVGIIDFESWKPVLRQNFGILTPYKDVSYEIEKKRHWWWKKQWIEEEAKRRFEGAGREFMQATISLAKKMRPQALWGYYGYPYCFNMAYNNRKESCADKVPQENDRISWLWEESTALYPSVYSSDDISGEQLAALIRGRLREAARVAGAGSVILPYFWYRYRDKGYFNESDLDTAFSTFYKSNASGFIIWGSSNDVNTVEKCKTLKTYVTDVLGPAVAKYTKPALRLEDNPDENYNVVYKPNNASKYDPEYTWIPPANYTKSVEKMVEEELKEEAEAAKVHKDIKESILVDMILHKIANYCAEGCDNKSKVRTTEDRDVNINESKVVLVTEDPFKKAVGVTVPTTTEDDIYDYDLSTGDVTVGELYETSEDSDLSTTTKSIQNTTLSPSTESTSTISISNEESGAISTTESNSMESQQNNLSTVEYSTTEASKTENNTVISTTEPSIEDTSASYRTTSLKPEETSTEFNNDVNIPESSINFNSIEAEFDVVNEGASTMNPTTEDGTTDDVNVSTSDYSTTVAPVITEQVLGSVSRAIVSKPLACSLFYLYSITKCFCVLLGTC